MNRRNFIKGVSCLLSGALASISGFVSAALPGTIAPKPERLSFDAGDISHELKAQIDERKYHKGCRNLQTKK